MCKIVYDENVTEEELKRLNIYIDPNCIIGENVVLCSGVKILKNSKINNGCELGVNSVVINSILEAGVKVVSSFVEDCLVGGNTTIGPFANLKKGSKIGANCRIGNFVEIKNSNVGDSVKIAHLTYVGDADVGNNCNIGCGVVFCNYDGEQKRRSVVEENVFIGSNVNIIAPVKIEKNVYIAAGSTINKDVESGQLAVARARQINKDNFDNPYLKNKKLNKNTQK